MKPKIENALLQISPGSWRFCALPNTQLERLHAGLGPITRTGDYSGLFVVDADGRRVPWRDVSHIDDIEIRDPMHAIINRLYAFHSKTEDPRLQVTIERWRDPR